MTNYFFSSDAETQKQWTEITLGASLAMLSFNIYEQFFDNIKTCVLNYSAWKQIFTRQQKIYFCWLTVAGSWQYQGLPSNSLPGGGRAGDSSALRFHWH